MDRVIEVALADLSERVNPDVGLASDPDRHLAVEMFRLLYKAGYVFRRDDVERWVLSHGWNPLAALDLGSIAEGVNQGRPFFLLTKGPGYPPGILETWGALAHRQKLRPFVKSGGNTVDVLLAADQILSDAD